MRRSRREKVFGPGRAVPLDRNAKARIASYARAWSRLHCLPGQHRGPITRAFLDVLEALLWGFHNSRSGCCFPSYERIAERAECARSTVAEALRVLEWAGVLTWQHRITRIRERCTDLFGRHGWRWRVIRTSNCYQFADPQATVFPADDKERIGCATRHCREFLHPRVVPSTSRQITLTIQRPVRMAPFLLQSAPVVGTPAARVVSPRLLSLVLLLG
jgi:hypothetical protein